jgi:crotonobetainyl-CoA:carnitine CoA-transferase CaiB-like acyl-CoA transferase
MSADAAATEIGPLAGIVVLDATDNVAGGYAGQLLADLGAEVVRLSAGDTGAGAVPAVLLRNRILPAADDTQAEDEQLRAALQVSDVLLLGPAADGLLDAAQNINLQPGLIRCTISPFGADSPWADRAGDDLIVQALAGAMEITGEPGRPPTRMGAPVLALMAGAQAAVAILATLQEQPGHDGRDIDVSLLDVSLSMLSYLAPMYLTLGTVPARVGSGHPTIYPYNAFKVADGYLVVAPFTGRFWRKFCEVLESPEWGQDERFRNFQDRLDNRHILEPMLNERMKQKTRAEWLALLEAGDVPCGPVNDVAEALSMEQTVARDMVVRIADEGGSHTSALAMPVKFTNADGRRYRPGYHAPRAGTLPAVRTVAGEPGLGRAGAPLAGIRVIDLTRMAAGPFCTEMLSDLGADVIKIEEPRIGDPTRRNVPMIDGLSSYFLSFNRGKRSVSIDMKTPQGREAVLDLIAGADVVVENFRPGVMERLGLDYDTVRAVDDRIVFASISGFGQTGPLRLKTSFDLVNQAVAGMLSITGEAERDPVRLGLPVGDLAGGQYTALGIVAALVQRQRTGLGAHIDVSLHDVLIALLGDLAQAYLDTGTVPGRLGSEYADRVPAAVFQAADGYLALEAWSDEAWPVLVEQLDLPALRDAGLATHAGRIARRSELDGLLASALQGRTVQEWVESFDASPVGAAPVLDVGDALDSEHAAARDLVREVPLPGGTHARTIGSAFHIDGRAVVSADGPPALGEHSDELLEHVPNLQTN